MKLREILEDRGIISRQYRFSPPGQNSENWLRVHKTPRDMLLLFWRGLPGSPKDDVAGGAIVYDEHLMKVSTGDEHRLPGWPVSFVTRSAPVRIMPDGVRIVPDIAGVLHGIQEVLQSLVKERIIDPHVIDPLIAEGRRYLDRGE